MPVVDLTGKDDLTFFFQPGIFNTAGQILIPRGFQFFTDYKDKDKWDNKRVTIIVKHGKKRPLLTVRVSQRWYSQGIDEPAYVVEVLFTPTNPNRAWPILKPYTLVYDYAAKRYKPLGTEEMAGPFPCGTPESGG